MLTRPATRLLIIGWDAADWLLIDPLIAQGRMPNLSRLIDAGVRADLSTQDPKLSPILWTSIATGKYADKHGILHFVEPNPSGDGLRVAASTSRKTKALWNILTQAGLKVNAVSWYASHQAEPISGCCVSNLFQDGEPASSGAPWPLQPASIHPDSMRESLAPLRVASWSIGAAQLRAFVPALSDAARSDQRPRTLAKQLSRMATVHNAATHLAQCTQWDCMMAFFETIDTIGHHFMEMHPPRMRHVSKSDARLYSSVMVRTYEHHDRCLGELLAAAPSDTTVILLSDHGFHSGDQRPVIGQVSPEDRAAVEASWHRPYGVLVMSGPGISKGAAPLRANILDIAPTALALLGLPVGKDMDGRILSECLAAPVATTPIESWDSLPGDAGMHPAEMRADPFESQDAINQLVDLGYMAAPADSIKSAIEVSARESKFNLAVVYMSTGRPGLAQPIFAQLHESYPQQQRFGNNLVSCLFAQGEHELAAATAREVLASAGDCPEVRLLLAGSLAHLNRHDEAREIARALETECSKRSDLALALGDSLTLLSQWEDAKRLYRAALALDPTEYKAHIGLAYCALGAREWEAAIESCLDASELSPVRPEAHDFLGVALAWAGDLPHAISSFQNALRLQPGLVDCHRFLALLLSASGDPSSAQSHEESAARLLKSAGTRPQPLPLPWGPAAWAAANGVAKGAS